jgi:hypothetical protein
LEKQTAAREEIERATESGGSEGKIQSGKETREEIIRGRYIGLL